MQKNPFDLSKELEISKQRSPKFGIPALDDACKLLRRGQTTIIATPPCGRRIELLCNTMYNVAVKQGMSVNFTTFGDTLESVWCELLSIESYNIGLNISFSDIHSTETPKETIELLVESLQSKLNNSGGNIIINSGHKLRDFNGLVDLLYKDEQPANLIILDGIESFPKLNLYDIKYVVDRLADLAITFRGIGTSIIISTVLRIKEELQLENNINKGLKATSGMLLKYERKAGNYLICYCNDKMDLMGRMDVYVTKCRNSRFPKTCVSIPIEYIHDIGIPFLLEDDMLEQDELDWVD